MSESKGSMLAKLLADHREFSPVLPCDPARTAIAVLDFSSNNRDLDALDTGNAEQLGQYVLRFLESRGAAVGLGRYNEQRVTYRHSDLYQESGDRRSVHLGIDLFADEGTSVRAPLMATIHSYADNEGLGNYGPTIILQHELQGFSFWTLYGHLTRGSLMGCREGMRVPAGSVVGRIGSAEENGSWPPHLHFQLIAEIGDWRGDFPGVAPPSRRSRFLEICPDPNLILRIPGL